MDAGAGAHCKSLAGRRGMIPPFRRDFDAARDPITAQSALQIGPYRSWTPTLTFATPGDLAVSYASRLGTLFTIGKFQILNFNITTSSFTFTTASGNLTISGVPNAPISSIPFIWNGF